MSDIHERSKSPEHFELHHEDDGEVIICMPSERECAIAVEIANGYTPEEMRLLTSSMEQALTDMDVFLDGKAADLFMGLHVKIGEGLASGGGEALSEQNMITLNGRALLMSVAEMREASGSYDPSELLTDMIDENEPGGALRYTFVHESGHIVDERTDGNVKHRVNASESPTTYGREPDQYNSEKDHEAFAEGFAHMVFGMPVTETMSGAVRATIQAKLAMSSEQESVGSL